jgi:crossover junction endodeoxyribonuclease RuvC
LKRKNSRLSRINPDRPEDDRIPSLDGPVVLGVDPGTLVTGYGLVTSGGRGIRLLSSGLIRNSGRLSLPDRLNHLHEELSRIIGIFKPSEFAIESAFYGKNAQSALKLGHARGALILAATRHGLPVSEYSPREIKKAVTGNGNASKPQIHFMVRSLLSVRDTSMTFDTADAIAAAICHLQSLHRRRGSARDWKSFVALHPERIV